MNTDDMLDEIRKLRTALARFESAVRRQQAQALVTAAAVSSECGYHAPGAPADSTGAPADSGQVV